MSSGSSASRSSSEVNLNTELGGQRVEVNAVRTGSQQSSSSKSAGIKTTVSQAHLDYSVGAPSTLAAPGEYSPGIPQQRASFFVPNSPYGLYDPYNPYSPYNPYNPYIVYAPRPPCPIHGYQGPSPVASLESTPANVTTPQPAAERPASPQPSTTTTGTPATSTSPQSAPKPSASPVAFVTPTTSPQPSAVSVCMGPAAEGSSSAGLPRPPRPLVFNLNGKEILVEDGFDIVEEYLNDRLVSRTVNGVLEPLPKKK